VIHSASRPVSGLHRHNDYVSCHLFIYVCTKKCVQGLFLGLLSMEKGEEAAIMVRSDYAFGSTVRMPNSQARGFSKSMESLSVHARANFFLTCVCLQGKNLHTGAYIPPNATLKYDIHMLRWNERDLFNDGGVIVRALPSLPSWFF
jgi:hypothetical protein